MLHAWEEKSRPFVLTMHAPFSPSLTSLLPLSQYIHRKVPFRIALHEYKNFRFDELALFFFFFFLVVMDMIFSNILTFVFFGSFPFFFPIYCVLVAPYFGASNAFFFATKLDADWLASNDAATNSNGRLGRLLTRRRREKETYRNVR